MFEIIANNLTRQSDIKSLKLQSDNYKVTFFYYGEYEEDMKENGCCDVRNLSMSCKIKRAALPISCMSGKMFIDIEKDLMLSMDEVAGFKEQLDSAHAAAVELEALVKQYFGI